ncbi:UNVERIFIED_CONTAM: putative membrane protein [Acetivibrio alkalicellulosi]
MNWIDKLERKYGKLAIKGLIKYIVIGAALIFVTVNLSRSLFISEMLNLNPNQVLRGQVWRLITFVIVPPDFGIFVVFALYILYIFGNALENIWGSFRFNVYYYIGIISAIIAAFVSGNVISVVYLNLSIFLAFAYINPNFKLLLFFIIPVKVKYLAWFNVFFVIYSIVFSGWPEKIAAIFSFTNFFIFFGNDMLNRWVLPKKDDFIKKRRRKKFKVITPPKSFEFIHKCRECGRTSKEFPQLTFGYCQICGSDYEYCEEHLNNHNHIT